MKQNQEGDNTRYQTGEHLIVEDVLEAKEKILKALGRNSKLILDLSQLNQVDTFGIQLLASALKSSSADYIKIENPTEDFRATCRKVGLFSICTETP
ncbi:STAS domain-containing protein [Pelagicoccus albus]|uniref:STAS domain-containing protein n=1 Tax=Pelagicoccus albus TaxID=415222 RepID=A0A7X1B6C3_9BACT|nr:STAS domain-containing protein [Pelagicoccus albus]MBC2606430.1 STAS domain-containing protein [Pelagicoccus albus]